MKYFIANIRTKTGEHEFYKDFVFQTKNEKCAFIHAYKLIIGWFNTPYQRENNSYSHNNFETITDLYSLKKIKKSEFNTLRKYIDTL